MIISDLTWLKKIVNIACFQIYRIIINELRVVNQLSVVISGRIRRLMHIVFKRCKHSKQLICLSRNDFLILLTLVKLMPNKSIFLRPKVEFDNKGVCYVNILM